MTIGVLVLHHYGVVGGASRSLFEVAGELHGRDVHMHLVAPQGGVAEAASRQNIETITAYGISQFDNTTFGHYRGRRWLVLLREFLFAPATIVAIWSAWRRWGARIDVIHANEYSLLFSGVFAKLLFKKPLVLHVRSLQEPKNRWRAWVLGLIAKRYVDRIVAIDTAVAASLGPDAQVQVIHNGQAPPEAQAVTSPDPNPSGLRVGIVANFVAYKGLLEFVEAARICANERGLTDVRFVVFGAGYRRTTGLRARVLRALGFVRDLQGEIEAIVQRESLASVLEFRGFVTEMEHIYGAMDVLCFPSHLDAVGRPVFEAAFFGLPSIVALRTRNEDDAIEHGRTGLIIPEKNAHALADAIVFFRDRPDAVRQMGEAARTLAAERFDVGRNALQLLGVYRELADCGLIAQTDTKGTPALAGRGRA